MKLSTRLWVFGAGLPVLGALALVLIAGQVLRYRLRSSLDQALLTQAAVESVSLFDAPGGQLHLHLERSPLLDAVEPFAPVAAVYDRRGALELSFPQGAHQVPPDPDALARSASPRLFDARTPEGEPRRVITLAVHDASQVPHLLVMHASLRQVAAAAHTFDAVGLLGVLVLAVALFGIQLTQGRALGRRIEALRAHLARVERGELRELSVDAASDEVGALGRVLAAATDALRLAREAEERLVAEAAHELRTPLALMRTEVDLALRKPRSPEELAEALRGVRAEVERLEQLAQRLLDLSRLNHEPARVSCDLRALTEAAIEQVKPLLEARQLAIELKAPPAAPLLADPVGVRQVLQNLLDNAVKFSPAKGRITARLSRDGARWRLEIHDDGPGVPADERERVFHPFHRLDPQVPGTGLGLAIVREVTERHGGRAGFDEVPRGATAFVELPAAA